MSSGWILALDQGTTSSRAMLFSEDGLVVAEGHAPLALQFPHPGWVEVDGEVLFASQWQAVVQCLKHAASLPNFDPQRIRAIGIANQRETTLLFEKATGRLVHPAIIWQCRRSVEVARAWREQGLEPLIRERTGLNLDPYFSSTKLGYLFQTYPGLFDRAQAGELLFGTVESFLIHRLTGLKSHITDVSNASRTAFFDINRMTWDEDLLHRMGIPLAILPTVVDTAGVKAITDPVWFGHGIPIASMVGDQQAALFGQGCHQPGQAKCTMGTGAFILENAGEASSPTPSGLIRTVAWRLPANKPVYALEGAVFTAGTLVNWLQDGLQLIAEPSETEAMARKVPDSGGVVMVPAFSGLGTPYWDPGARGLIIGMTSKTSREHLVRAALESIAFQIVDVLKAMDVPPSQLEVDGGVAQNNFVTQFLADVAEMTVVRHRMAEATARGAAWLAGLATEFWPSIASLPLDARGETRTFVPAATQAENAAGYARWRRAVERARGWEEVH